MTPEQKRAHERLTAVLPSRTYHRLEINTEERRKQGNWRALSEEESRKLNEEIMRRHKAGMNNKDISKELNVSPSTVGRHVQGTVKCAPGYKKPRR